MAKLSMAVVVSTAVVVIVIATSPDAVVAQTGGQSPATRLAHVIPNQPGANVAEKLRAAPLPADSLARRPAIGGTSTYSVPYGPNLIRPAGSAIVPFGSSRYYYRP